MTDATIHEITSECLLTRTRRISRVMTAIYDEALRPFGINAPQFSLLVLISRLDGASRAEIGRANNQERSTLTRNLQVLLSQGWVEEVAHKAGGRNRAIVLAARGQELLRQAVPAWRSAQKTAKRMLGATGVTAVMDMARDLPRQTV